MRGGGEGRNGLTHLLFLSLLFVCVSMYMCVNICSGHGIPSWFWFHGCMGVFTSFTPSGHIAA